MSVEDRILALMSEQVKLALEVKRLQAEIPANQPAIDRAKQRHRETVNQLIAELYDPLKKALEGLRPRLQNEGVQYTEMVHDFFLKLFERQVTKDFGTFADLRTFVATVLMNQFRDHLKSQKTHQKHHESGLTVIAEQKQVYFEQRYGDSYIDFLDRIEQWELSDDVDYQDAARVALRHYVAGEDWGFIRSELGIDELRFTKLRRLLAREFRQRDMMG